MLVLLLTIGPRISNAQDSEKGVELDKSSWEKERQDIDYGDMEAKEARKKYDPDIDLDFDGGWAMGPVAKAIAFGLVILLLLWILYKLFGNMVIGERIKEKDRHQYTLEDIEENLEESDLDFFLKQSLDSNDYRPAVRLFYLQIIKELSLRNWIQYEKDKTNFSYVAELRAKKEYHTFRDLTTAFEIVWYSDALIEARHFEKLSPLFRQFIERLDPLPHVE